MTYGARYRVGVADIRRFQAPELHKQARFFSFGNLRATLAVFHLVRYICLHCCGFCDSASMKPIEARDASAFAARSAPPSRLCVVVFLLESIPGLRAGKTPPALKPP